MREINNVPAINSKATYAPLLLRGEIEIFDLQKDIRQFVVIKFKDMDLKKKEILFSLDGQS